VPPQVTGKIKVVGLLEGWPFPCKEEVTERDLNVKKPAVP
jgi:hypothetical protein